MQPCNWKIAACASTPPAANCPLGKKISFVPYFPVEVNFPYACVAGYLGSNESAYQTSSDCAGKCPAGFFCPNASTIEAQPCPPAHYCAEGAAMPLPCPGGTFSNSSNLRSVAECTACPAGSACSVGSLEPSSCFPGSFSATSGASTCDLCPEGKFTSTSGNTACDPCTSGYLCVKGASAPQPCGGGTHANQTVLNITGYLSSLDECVICPAGTSCSVGTDKPVPCLPGSFSAASQASTCDLCPAGKFQRLYGQTACIPCTPGFYCRAGAAEPTPCPAGTVGNATGLYSENQCTYVPAGFWAPLG